MLRRLRRRQQLAVLGLGLQRLLRVRGTEEEAQRGQEVRGQVQGLQVEQVQEQAEEEDHRSTCQP